MFNDSTPKNHQLKMWFKEQGGMGHSMVCHILKGADLKSLVE